MCIHISKIQNFNQIIYELYEKKRKLGWNRNAKYTMLYLKLHYTLYYIQVSKATETTIILRKKTELNPGWLNKLLEIRIDIENVMIISSIGFKHFSRYNVILKVKKL